MGYPRGFNLRCLDSWTLGVDPSLKPPDFKSQLQGAQLGVWRFETRSTQKSGEYTKCPIQDFIDFAIKLFHKFLIIICYFHVILYDSDIPLS